MNSARVIKGEKFNQQAWLLRFNDKNQRDKAFNDLILEFQEKLYLHIRRMLGNHDDTDDALQMTFINAWKGLATFRSDSKLYTWLYRIASNEAINILKKRKGDLYLSLDDEEQYIPEPSASSDGLDSGIVLKFLNEAIDELPPKQKMVFNLKYFESMKFEEISEVTGTSVGALKSTYHHAVKKVEVFIRSKAI